MKTKVVIVILAVACVGLVIGLLVSQKQSDEQHKSDVARAVDYSNQLVLVNQRVIDLGQERLDLSNHLAASEQKVALSQGQLGELSNSLAAANATLADTKTSLAGAQELVTNLNIRISDLETQNKLLDQETDSLSNALTRLTAQIEDTKNQLAVAQTNAAFLQGELHKQLMQKAELEHKFNDLGELRAQVKKIKEEMFIARRLQLMKSDTGNKKGGELLMMHGSSLTGPSKRSTNYDLNVEVGSDGSVKVIPPGGSTNGPAR